MSTTTWESGSGTLAITTTFHVNFDGSCCFPSSELGREKEQEGRYLFKILVTAVMDKHYIFTAVITGSYTQLTTASATKIQNTVLGCMGRGGRREPHLERAPEALVAPCWCTPQAPPRTSAGALLCGRSRSSAVLSPRTLPARKEHGPLGTEHLPSTSSQGEPCGDQGPPAQTPPLRSGAGVGLSMHTLL